MTGIYSRTGPLWPSAGGRRFGVDGVPAGVRVRVSRRPVISRPGSTESMLGSWTQATVHEVDGVATDRMVASVIQGDSGDTSLQTSTLFGPALADIRDGDRVTFPDGTIVEVNGIPSREPNMLNGWMPPMSVPVRVTHG